MKLGCGGKNVRNVWRVQRENNLYITLCISLSWLDLPIICGQMTDTDYVVWSDDCHMHSLQFMQTKQFFLSVLISLVWTLFEFWIDIWHCHKRCWCIMSKIEGTFVHLWLDKVQLSSNKLPLKHWFHVRFKTNVDKYWEKRKRVGGWRM